MFGISEARIAWIKKEDVMTLDELLDLGADAVEEAARETDTTILELLHTLNDAEEKTGEVMAWLEGQIEAMSDYIEDQIIDNSVCPACNGASTPELQCYSCGCSGKAANDAAEAEYNADAKADEEWLRRNEG